jgi:hypothetical protein
MLVCFDIFHFVKDLVLCAKNILNLHTQHEALSHSVLPSGVNLKQLRYGLHRKLPACVFLTELTSARRGFHQKDLSGLP